MSVVPDIDFHPDGRASTPSSRLLASQPLASSLLRLVSKARVLAAQSPNHGVGHLPPTIGLSDIDDTSSGDAQLFRLESRIASLEAKLDVLLASRLGNQSPPAWHSASEQRVLTSISNLSNDCLRIAAVSRSAIDLSTRLQCEVENLAAGADKFLAGLAVQLSKSECALFLALIASMQDGAVRRVLTYAEIGKQRGVSKQAIQKAYKSLSAAHPSVGDYIHSIRRPNSPAKFSELSPSERRTYGVESCYDHPAG